MGGSKYNRLLGNKFFYKYKYSLANISSSISQCRSTQERFNYLENSIIPTYHFQKSLTKLAIPKLETTLDRYVNALKPLLSEQDLKSAKQSADEFGANEGKVLDEQIRALDAQDKSGNYISEPWYDMYLRAREPILLNYNPYLAFKPDPNPSQMNQAIRTSNFLISALRFRNSLKENKLSPEIFHLNPDKSDTLLFKRLMRLAPESYSFYAAYMFNAFPLDMSQYHRLFNSSRVPRKGKDELVKGDNKPHILVAHRGHFFVFPVLDDKDNILPSEEIYACIRHILDAGLQEANDSIGVLTSENRDTWAALREQLVACGNEEALSAIDTALFCISLDETNSNEPDDLAHGFLHGNANNRWFDKNHTLIVNANGQAGINFEHSWGDGVAMIRFFNEIYDDSAKNAFVTASTKPAFERGDLKSYVKKLEFKLNDELKTAIERAHVAYKKSTSRVNIMHFETALYGKDLAKKYGLSPDSIMQSGIQIAALKCFHKPVSTYEAASTCAFKLGRTETVRPATLATKRLAEYFYKSGEGTSPLLSHADEVLAMMKECSSIHNKLVKEGALGQGFDRHLFALKYHAVDRLKRDLPAFYKTKEYAFINHNVLSTSTLAYPNILTGGFAPVVPDGFGIAYRILENQLGACVSAYERPADLAMFVKELEKTYILFHDILKKTS